MYGKKSDMSVMVGTINVDEIIEATRCIVLLVQVEAFSDEIDGIKRTEEEYSGEMEPLSTKQYVNARWQIRNARENCPISHCNYSVSELIIWHYHEAGGHAGLKHVLSVVRNYFWIVKSAAAVRRVIRDLY